MSLEFLLQSDTTDGDTTFVDDSSNNYSLSTWGNPTHSTNQSKVGSSSLKMDGFYGEGDRDVIIFTLNDTFGDSDFVAGFYLYATDYSASVNIQLFGTGNGQFSVYFDTSGNIVGEIDTSSGVKSVSSSYSGKFNAWHFVALVRDGTTLKLFIDDTLADSESVGSLSISNTNKTTHVAGGSQNVDPIITSYLDYVYILLDEAKDYTTDPLPPSLHGSFDSPVDQMSAAGDVSPNGTGDFNLLADIVSAAGNADIVSTGDFQDPASFIGGLIGDIGHISDFVPIVSAVGNADIVSSGDYSGTLVDQISAVQTQHASGSFICPSDIFTVVPGLHGSGDFADPSPKAEAYVGISGNAVCLLDSVSGIMSVALPCDGDYKEQIVIISGAGNTDIVCNGTFAEPQSIVNAVLLNTGVIASGHFVCPPDKAEGTEQYGQNTGNFVSPKDTVSASYTTAVDRGIFRHVRGQIQ